MRFLNDLLLGAIKLYAAFYVVLTLGQDAFDAGGAIAESSAALIEAHPFLHLVSHVSVIWLALQIIPIFLTKRRQCAHGVIAGTIVVELR